MFFYAHVERAIAVEAAIIPTTRARSHVLQRRPIELVAGDVDTDRRVIPLAASQKTRAHNTDRIAETSMR